MKRKTFKGLLGKNIIIGIVAAILVIVLTGVIALKFVLITTEKNFVSNQDRFVKYYQLRYLIAQKNNPEASDEELLRDTYDYIECETAFGWKYVSVDNVLFSSSAVYNQDTGELIADSHEIAYIDLIDNETNYTQFLFCHESKLEELKNFMDGDRFLVLMDAVVRDYYVIDGRKYFGRVDFYNDWGDGELAATIDFTPDLSGEYEHVIVDNEKYKTTEPSYWGYEKTDKEIVELEKYVENGYWFHSMNDDYQYEVNDFVITVMGTKTFRLPDGTSLRLFNRANIDLYGNYGKQMIGFCIAVTAAAILIAVFTAYIKFVKLRAAYRMEDYRKTLTDSMAHDLKSPLMAISGYAENLRENINTDKREHYADSIISNVQYMNDIISNILQLSRFEDKKTDINKEKLELGRLVEKCMEKYEELISDKNLKVVIKNDVSVKGDERLLSQAFDNILGNAVKYSDCDGVIEIVSEDNIMSGVKRITISNVCTQEPDTEVSKLWKPFIRGDNSRGNNMGTGIGLTISKSILEMHGFKQKLSYKDERFIVEIQLN